MQCKKTIIRLAFLSVIFFVDLYAQKKHYALSNEPIDVVFVCHPKDQKTLNPAIEGITKNGKNVRRIIVVSAQKLTDLAEWFDETQYPFTKKDLAIEIFKNDTQAADAFLSNPNSRMGWIYQQFLKLYAHRVIPHISSNILIIDADTIFLNETEFIDSQGNPLFNPGFEYQHSYFSHASRLLPGFERVFNNYSGISHHMIFQKAILEDLFEEITRIHHIEPWKALCRCISTGFHDFFSCLSEYEIYFNFIFSRTDQAKIRLLKWKNMTFNGQTIQVNEYRNQGYHYISCHSY